MLNIVFNPFHELLIIQRQLLYFDHLAKYNSGIKVATGRFGTIFSRF